MVVDCIFLKYISSCWKFKWCSKRNRFVALEKGELYMENIYLKSLLKKFIWSIVPWTYLYIFYRVINNIFSKYNLYINKINFNNMQGGSFLIKLTRKNKNVKLIKRVIANEKNNKLFLKKKRFNK